MKIFLFKLNCIFLYKYQYNTFLLSLYKLPPWSVTLPLHTVENAALTVDNTLSFFQRSFTFRYDVNLAWLYVIVN